MARVSARLGEVESRYGQLEQAIERMERAYAVISTDEPDEDLGLLAARLALSYWFAGDSRAGRGASRACARHRRVALASGGARARLDDEGDAHHRAGTSRGGTRAVQARARAFPRARAQPARGECLRQPLRHLVSTRSLRGGVRLPAPGARARPQGRRSAGRVVLLERDDLRALHDGPLGRVAGNSRRDPGGEARGRRHADQPADLGARDPPPPRGPRRGTPPLRRLRPPGRVKRCPGSGVLCGRPGGAGAGRGSLPRGARRSRARAVSLSTVSVANQGVKQALVHGIEAALAIGDREQAEGLLPRSKACRPGVGRRSSTGRHIGSGRGSPRQPTKPTRRTPPPPPASASSSCRSGWR